MLEFGLYLPLLHSGRQAPETWLPVYPLILEKCEWWKILSYCIKDTISGGNTKGISLGPISHEFMAANAQSSSFSPVKCAFRRASLGAEYSGKRVPFQFFKSRFQ